MASTTVPSASIIALSASLLITPPTRNGGGPRARAVADTTPGSRTIRGTRLDRCTVQGGPARVRRYRRRHRAGCARTPVRCAPARRSRRPADRALVVEIVPGRQGARDVVRGQRGVGDVEVPRGAALLRLDQLGSTRPVVVGLAVAFVHLAGGVPGEPRAPPRHRDHSV